MKRWKHIELLRKTLILPPVIIGVAAVVVFVRSQNELARSEHAEQPRPLPVIRVQPTEVTPTVTGFGTASTSRRWNAVSEVQGRIVEIHPHLESGNSIKANELLVRIDDKDSQLLLSQRQADLDSAKARLQELVDGNTSDQRLLMVARQQLEIAVREEQRLTKLNQTRAVSLSELDQAKSDRLTQEQTVQNFQRSINLYPSQVKGAMAAIALAEAKVSEAERDVERTCIYSPFSGVLSKVDLEVGQFVGVHESLFELLDDQKIEVTAHFSLEQIAKLGDSNQNNESRTAEPSRRFNSVTSGRVIERFPFTAQVIARSGNFTRTWNGIPVRITESLNEQSRTLGVVVQVANMPWEETVRDSVSVSSGNSRSSFTNRVNTLRPGTFCEVVLQGPRRNDLITVPRSAMNGETVYLIDKDNRLRSRQVDLGFSFAESVTILHGLREGEVISAIAPVPAIEGQLIDSRFDESLPVQASISSTDTASALQNAKEGRR